MIKNSKQDRQGVRTAPQLEQKYNFGKRFAEILGIANDASERARLAASELHKTNDKIVEMETSIKRNSESITLTASKVEKLGDQVDESKTQINQNAEAITLTASKVEKAEGRIETAESRIEQNAESITSTVKKVEEAENRITEAESRIEQNTESITSTVTKVEEAEGRIERSEAQIQLNNEQIASKVSKTEVDEKFATKAEMSSMLVQTQKDITATFSQSISALDADTKDLDSQFKELYKYIKLSGETAITIGSGDSAVTVELDNETGLVFKRNGETFGSWDGTNFYTGNIVVEVSKRAQFGNFAFVPRSDGSLMLLKVR